MSSWPDPQPLRARWAALDLRCARALHCDLQAAGQLQRLGVRLLVLTSRAGDGTLWVALMLALLPFGGAKGGEVMLQMFGLGALNLVLYSTIKRKVGRARPFDCCDDIHAATRPLDAFSFPSGHTMHAVSFALLLSHHYPKVALALWAFAALVAVSRVVLGLHYPTDVAAGALAGAATAAMLVSAFG